jgi:hypothetical protein
MKRLLLQFIPILLLFILITYFNDTAIFSRTILGKFIAICIIIFYASIDKLYGLLVCAIIILYYQSDFIENMLNYGGDWAIFESSPSMDNNASLVDDPIVIGGVFKQSLEPFMSIEKAYQDDLSRSTNPLINDEFRKNHCINGKLIDKSIPVRLDMTEHIFPEITFNDKPCNTCSKTCGFSITENKLLKETSMKPIYSKNQ